ncbi:MAG: DUF2063 domain-containing protein [Comamonadaceae bacterium CG2_30_60_41]|nr:MAG: DUF2063 domain-containing protein [Comamonadaceae bacterium CG2_30_60_41]
MNSQTAFAVPLLAPDLPCPSGLKTWNNSDPATRYAVYRNNVVVSLIDALADTYPVVQQLVGEEFFRAMAKVFALANPPRSAVMAYYGQGLADFVASFPPAASVPYLADVARLEMAQVLAYHAADVLPLPNQALQSALTDPHQLEHLRLGLHPSVQVIASPFAVVSLWAAHQGTTSLSTVDPDVAQTALVFRHALDVNTLELRPGAGVFIGALQAGQTLMAAASQASEQATNFDLSGALALLLHWQLITTITPGDDHEPEH